MVRAYVFGCSGVQALETHYLGRCDVEMTGQSAGGMRPGRGVNGRNEVCSFRALTPGGEVGLGVEPCWGR